MAKELKERTEIKKKLKKKNDRISFDFSDKLAGQLRRCTADLNRLARIDRIIDKKQTLYSVDTNRKPDILRLFAIINQLTYTIMKRVFNELTPNARLRHECMHKGMRKRNCKPQMPSGQHDKQPTAKSF